MNYDARSKSLGDYNICTKKGPFSEVYIDKKHNITLEFSSKLVFFCEVILND